MRRMMRWIANAVSDSYTEPEVHFHQGPELTPVVCHDERCPLPRLSV